MEVYSCLYTSDQIGSKEGAKKKRKFSTPIHMLIETQRGIIIDTSQTKELDKRKNTEKSRAINNQQSTINNPPPNHFYPRILRMQLSVNSWAASPWLTWVYESLGPRGIVGDTSLCQSDRNYGPKWSWRGHAWLRPPIPVGTVMETTSLPYGYIVHELMINMRNGSIVSKVNVQSVWLEVLRYHLSWLNDASLLGQVCLCKCCSITALADLLPNQLVHPVIGLWAAGVDTWDYERHAEGFWVVKWPGQWLVYGQSWLRPGSLSSSSTKAKASVCTFLIFQAVSSYVHAVNITSNVNL